MTRPLTEDSKPHAWFAAHGSISNISDFIATEPFRDPAVMDRFAAALSRGGVPQRRATA